jgi:DNA-binding XRE family transcriptional regulator
MAFLEELIRGNTAESKQAVAARLRRIRIASGMNQSDFAKTIVTAQNTYSAYENGSRMCSLEAAILIAKKYDVTLDYIFMGVVDGLTVKRAREVNSVKPQLQEGGPST